MNPFKMIDNIVTFVIMSVIILLLAQAGAYAHAGSIKGIVPLILVILMVIYGWTPHGVIKGEKGEEINTIGFLTFIGSPIKMAGKCLIVRCSVILAPYLGITSVKIDKTPKTIERDVDILSLEPSGARIQRKIKIRATIKPDEENLTAFITYGNGSYGKIEMDLSGLITIKTEEIAQGLSIFTMAASGATVSGPLFAVLDEAIKLGGFGVKLIQIQAECTVPESIANAAEEISKAQFETQARIITSTGMDKIALKILSDARENSDTDMTLDKARKLAYTDSLLENERLNRIQLEIIGNEGGTNPLIFNVSNMSLGDQQGDSKNKKRKDK